MSTAEGSEMHSNDHLPHGTLGEYDQVTYILATQAEQATYTRGGPDEPMLHADQGGGHPSYTSRGQNDVTMPDLHAFPDQALDGKGGPGVTPNPTASRSYASAVLEASKSADRNCVLIRTATCERKEKADNMTR
ncbi:unnamed protein product [Peronospora belbahrii]|uniref:Uncharacterized protein n=1 Tax=Peronospora belbahrii TaxID=622444 RepID=A0AAU9LA42_9STRA|nr:unnamed protein product [Peronospora belbahrii]CAH0520332.1 unnamed protein product [Peronospora belbahrii]